MKEARIRLTHRELMSETPINKPNDAYDFIQKIFGELDQETVIVLNLDNACKPISYFQAAVGAMDRCFFSARDCFKTAILEGTSRIIVMHNHPSGDLSPSEYDIQVTDQLIRAGNLLGIEVLDHIIFGPKPSLLFSMEKNGRMERPMEYTTDIQNLHFAVAEKEV